MVSLVVEFLGGTESIVACIEWTLAHLVTLPDAQQKLRRAAAIDDNADVFIADNRLDQLPYLHAVVLESLRLHPPFRLTWRDVRAEAVQIGSTTVPPGGLQVHFMLRDIGRDDKLWTDPDLFRPERFLPGGEGESVAPLPGSKEIRMMPFGAGQRACPGAGLAMMYVKCFLAALVRDFQWTLPKESCAGGGGIDMTESFGFITVMKTPLKARMMRSRY